MAAFDAEVIQDFSRKVCGVRFSATNYRSVMVLTIYMKLFVCSLNI